MSSLKKINAVIVGATGYVGLDLIKILSKHPKVNIKYLRTVLCVCTRGFKPHS